jgi:hypothetical protein
MALALKNADFRPRKFMSFNLLHCAESQASFSDLENAKSE